MSYYTIMMYDSLTFNSYRLRHSWQYVYIPVPSLFWYSVSIRSLTLTLYVFV